jgi:hypothetical protein
VSNGLWLLLINKKYRSRREASLQMSGTMTEAVVDFVILDIKMMRSIRVAVIEGIALNLFIEFTC